MQILPGGTATFLLLFGLFLGAFAVRSALRLYRVLRLLQRGERVGGRCTDRLTVDRGPGSERGYTTEYVFAFRTRDGRDVEFTARAPGPFGFEVGAPIQVSYDPADPEHRVTIAGPEAWGPVLMPAVFTPMLGAFAGMLLAGFAAMRGWI
ncbi:DUF3592 domain-containing protein [Streptomyces sp. NPDC006435]|uniref:DUF3592 domain-containing protein n=1 Tax=Streptomyces sp. NPDC006435 TaxID=3154300 RepID=UPI0033B67849